MPTPAQFVWYKRDLRIRDHKPLLLASKAGPVAPLYIIEPSMLHAPDFDVTHYIFIQHSLRELRKELTQLGQPLIVRVGEAVEVFEELRREGWLAGVWAHEETANGLSYARDRAVRAWAKTNRIPFCELPGCGVVRRLKSRDSWSQTWDARMREKIEPPPESLPHLDGLEIGRIPDYREAGFESSQRAVMQTGGEAAGSRTLNSFLESRGGQYHWAMSNPSAATLSCSRISPYIAFGNLSVRQTLQANRARIEALDCEPQTNRTIQWRRALLSFEERLHWRDHFIQKLEDEPQIEFHNLHRGYDGLRENEFDLERFEAWKTGNTGYPLIDACMRSLIATGWLNFRMRALLVSFASYTLWLHWREPSLHLARLFLDYEPGIHYCQFQMQSGTTGINTFRIYNPTKQAKERDREGEFIRKWIPELRGTPDEYLAAPWEMPSSVQNAHGCVVGTDYPAPIVDHEITVKYAKSRIYDVRNRPETQLEADLIREKHGSRRRPANMKLKDTRWNGQLKMEFENADQKRND